MNQQNYFLSIFVAGVMAAMSVGCDDSGSGGETTATATSTATSTSTSTSTATGMGVELKADSGGFVPADSNSLQVTGAWYAYADSLGAGGLPPGACQTVGMHKNEECATVTTPAPGTPFAPTPDGKQCTSGKVEAVLAMDYGNMWGAGIGIDFNNAGMEKKSFNAEAKGVKGISFVIDAPPPAGIRVEVPDEATNGKSAAYWGAGSSYPDSPVKAGPNTILWDMIVPPEMAVPKLDKTKIMGVQFHVPSGDAGDYSFCISKLTLLQ